MDLNKDFLQKVTPAIRSTWGQIAPDAFVEDNEEAMELTLDADRLTMAGHKDVDDLLELAFKENGYTPVFVMLCTHINLY